MPDGIETEADQEKMIRIKQEADNLFNIGPRFEATFSTLLGYLSDPNPSVRKYASETLSIQSKSIDRLVQIYKDNYDTDVRTSILAGRVIGRKADNGKFEIIHPIYAQMRFGLNIAFVPCCCAHCGGMNAGIPIPEYGIYKGYYGQTDYRGEFFLPVLCDVCSREFFIAWDENPEIP